MSIVCLCVVDIQITEFFLYINYKNDQKIHHAGQQFFLTEI